MTEIYVTIGGVPMTHAEYKAWKRAKCGGGKAVRAPRAESSERVMIKSLAEEIARLYSKVKVIESIQCFYRNGYSQWGNSFRMVVNINAIRKPMVMFMAAARKIKPYTEEIERLCKRGSKCVFQLIEKLSYMLDDVKIALQALCDGVRKSAVCYELYQQPCINERGKRLGLAVLMSRSERALADMDKIIGEVFEMSRM